jgi:pimeloyl-ACP methyl ester carboxylesterase
MSSKLYILCFFVIISAFECENNFVEKRNNDTNILLIGGLIGRDNTYLETLEDSLKSLDIRTSLVINYFDEKPIDVTIDTYCQNIIYQRKNMNKKSVFIMAHGFGGTLLIKSIRNIPELFKDDILIFCNSTSLISDSLTRSENSPYYRLLQPKDGEIIAQFGTKLLQGKLSENKLFEIYDSLMINNLVYDNIKKNEVWNHIKKYKKFKYLETTFFFNIKNEQFDFRKYLSSLSNKIYIIQSSNDFFTKNAMEDFFVSNNKIQKFKIQKAGHFPWLERPDMFYTCLIDILTQKM